MIKIFHEAPTSIFDLVQRKTDGDYALVHLFESNKAYRDCFVDAVRRGREVILDNSVFELGTAFATEQYARWIRFLRPTWYIVPDSLDDAAGTIKRFEEFKESFPDLPGKSIGVVQGRSLDEVQDVYSFMQNACDMVAFSMDSAADPGVGGRARILEAMHSKQLINPYKRHHLLGVQRPQEIKEYSNWPWIYSVDTSNPVVHGIAGIEYSPEGDLDTKLSLKLCDLVDYPVSVQKWDIIKYNMQKFRRNANEKMDCDVLAHW